MEFEPKTFAIPSNLCKRAGVAAQWLPINQIGVYPYMHVNHKTKDKVSDYGPDDAYIFHIRQEVILFEPILRKLVNESNGIFMSLQKLASSDVPEFKSELIAFSRQYRSVVRACLENLRNELMQAKSDQKEILQNYITVFYSVECTWHLCEILFIENIPGNTVLGHLLEWVRFHFPKYERSAAILLTSNLLGIESEPDYWVTVIGCLLQGRIEIVRALLRLHSSADTDHFLLADHILKSMPIFIHGGIPINEFQLRWKHWMVDTQAKIDAKLFIADKNLQLLMGLIIGDETCWAEAQNQCETWYELLAGWLFYTEPTVKPYELGDFAKRCITRMNETNRLKHLDRVLIAAMEADILQVVHEIQEMTDNGWFVSHLTDLLYHAKRLDELDKSEAEEDASKRLRESFLLDYGTMLMGHHSLWQVGLSYLDYCPIYGIAAIELLLPRLPLRNESRIMKIIKEAHKRQLPNIAHVICKVQSMVCLGNERLGSALMWAIKSQDSLLISNVADLYLKNFMKTGTMENIDMLDNLGDGILMSDRLIFLGKYREFSKCFKSGDYKNAVDLYIPLISSKIVPKYFWSTLLSDALPLLNIEELILSSNDTFTILQCVEEKYKFLNSEEKITTIRLAIAKNLSKSLVHEAEVS